MDNYMAIICLNTNYHEYPTKAREAHAEMLSLSLVCRDDLVY